MKNPFRVTPKQMKRARESYKRGRMPADEYIRKGYVKLRRAQRGSLEV